MRRCDSLKNESKNLMQEIRCRSFSLAQNKGKNQLMKENIQLHNYLETQILSTAKLNLRSAKYVKKNTISSYLQNPAYYNKLLSSVTKKRMSLQSIASKQFTIKQEKSMWKIVNQSDFHGFK
ncbi:unnamed protein product (macronuclear) [Paramecium tetraurelia]|uniref:Uncharacterized protein n=1 Tax=Paramecium tetraurelia TaxID=5888 RepID=A0BNV0_PARTE|nr:uncharacterized protein GSPATT00030856001 [Paramecium tetraurelia]CAK60217.1 unnamed protein product [Paramecium tetraurelia]|eukprot:XP_001427615.1 hypothetical protein (macronuclear) [Paramecium tetraurelia strain d4-2]